MYESHFGLDRQPFVSTPTLDRYFPSESLESAYETANRVIERGEGPVAIFGGHGLGKSLLALRLADAWRKSFEIIMLNSSKLCTRRALLQSLLFELRMPYRDMSEGELRLSLMDRIQYSIENPSEGLVLIVDEAQTLDIKLLEEIRLITNLARNGKPRVRLVLMGTVRLEESLGHPKSEALNQRIAARCFLNPLGSDEAVAYLKHKIEICGANASTVFSDDSMKAIHRAADGIPRILDQIADQSLILAAQQNEKPVSANLVDRAWATLQQIPAPWVDRDLQSIGTSDSANEVQFGTLSDDEEVVFDDQSGIESFAANSDSSSKPDIVPIEIADFEFATESSASQSTADQASSDGKNTEANDVFELPETVDFEGLEKFGISAASPETGLTEPTIGEFGDADNPQLEAPNSAPSIESQLQPKASLHSSDVDSQEYQLQPLTEDPVAPNHAEASVDKAQAIAFDDSSTEQVDADSSVSEDCDLSGDEGGSTCDTAELFGNDFDEEFIIGAGDANVQVFNCFDSFGACDGLSENRSTVTEETPTFVSETTGDSGSEAPMQLELAPQVDSDLPLSDIEEIPLELASSDLNTRDSENSSDLSAKITEIEQNLESEIRDLISGMNLNAISLDPFDTITSVDVAASGGESTSEGSQSPEQDSKIESEAQQAGKSVGSQTFNNDQGSEILSFSNIDDKKQFGDDREMLVVEDDLPSVMQSTVSESVPPMKTSAPSDYAQLFSRLRG